MPRPVTARLVGAAPAASLFGPTDNGAGGDPVPLGLDELEALRLADLEGLYQEAAARRMGVSRQTFGRIVESARRKTADAIVNGRALVVGGGIVDAREEPTMKVAVPTKDGMVDEHFGHCSYYSIFTAREGSAADEERWEAPAGCGCKSGIAADLAKAGVKALVAGNIGEGAVRVLGSHGIRVVRGASGPVREAAEAFLAGKLVDGGANCAGHEHGHEGCGSH